MLAAKAWLNKLNSAFEINFASSGASATVNMWDSWTIATPAIGTQLSNGAANVQTALTLTSRSATMAVLPHQRNASYARPEAMASGAKQAASDLLAAFQNLVVAALKSASAGLSITLPAGYIDFVIPSAATNPDMVNNCVASVMRLLEFVRANVGGDWRDEDAWILGNPTSVARFKASALGGQFKGYLDRGTDGQATFDGVPIYSLAGAANFGGASNETLFVGYKTGVAAKFDEPFVHGGGWRDTEDGGRAWTLISTLAYGVVETEFIGEIVNPGS